MSRRSGFTLMEVLVALGISALAALAVAGAFLGAAETKDAHEEAREMSHTAFMILDRFRYEMGSAYLSALGDPEADEDALGYTGFLGRHRQRGGQDMDEVEFTTLNHVTLPGRVSSEHAEVGYTTDYDDRLKTTVLFHREDQTPDFEYDDGGAAFLMASGIEGFSLRYYDGKIGDWSAEWEAARRTPPMLPMLVRAEVRFKTQRGNEMVYSTVVKVEQAYNFIKKERQAVQ